MPFGLPRAVVPLALVLLGACSHPRDGLEAFEGRIFFHSQEAKGPETDFIVTAKGDVLRVDMPVAPAAKSGEVALGHAVYEHASNRVRLFFDSTKEYRDMDLSSRIAAPGGSSAAAALERKGGKQTVAGFTCEDWTVKTPDGGHTDVCLTKGLAYLEFFRVHLGPHKTESPLAREYREHSTFPLEMVEYDKDGAERARVRVTKIERASVSDDTFSLPPDYTKVDPHFDDPPSRSSGPASPSRPR